MVDCFNNKDPYSIPERKGTIQARRKQTKEQKQRCTSRQPHHGWTCMKNACNVLWKPIHKKRLVNKVYWVAPVFGGILAASFYEYLFFPNPELKKRYSQTLSKAPFTSTKYREVQARLSTDLLGKQPLFTNMERAERKERQQEMFQVRYCPLYD